MYGISADSTFCHDAWRAHLGLPDDLVLLSDYNHEFGDTYGISFTNPSGFVGVLRRTVFVVMPDGKIAYRWDNPDPPRTPTPDEVLEPLKTALGKS